MRASDVTVLGSAQPGGSSGERARLRDRDRIRHLSLAEAVGGVQSLALEKPSDGYRWRPDRARACEYVADFERIGRHMLRRPEWKGRLRLFETYFVAGVKYRRAIQLVGVAEGTFDYWFQEVKRTLGGEYSRTGIFPPSAYFQTRNGEAARRAATGTSDSSVERGPQRPDECVPIESETCVAIPSSETVESVECLL